MKKVFNQTYSLIREAQRYDYECDSPNEAPLWEDLAKLPYYKECMSINRSKLPYKSTGERYRFSKQLKGKKYIRAQIDRDALIG
jgi:hypothetical protein